MTSQAELDDRYGVAPPWRRRLGWAVVAGVAAVFLGWVAWAAWFHGTPEVRSNLVGYSVDPPHRATAVVEVRLGDGVRATCRLRATAADRTTVGEVSFTPVEGRNEIDVRTERRASGVESLGCTSPGQNRPR